MKILAIVGMLIAASSGCLYGQSLEKLTGITFTKETRGFLDEVVITRDSVQGFSENHRTPEKAVHYATEVHTDDWARLMFALKNVSLQEIDGLQSPTTNRAHDGAMHSTLSFSFEDGSTISHSFDDEDPHPDLQPLLEVILELKVPTSR